MAINIERLMKSKCVTVKGNRFITVYKVSDKPEYTFRIFKINRHFLIPRFMWKIMDKLFAKNN